MAYGKNENGLTPNQQVFCDEYLIDHNATRAYRTAYPRIRNDGVAKTSGSRLLTNVNVFAYLTAREAELHSARTASAEEVRQFLTSVMRGQETEQVPLFMVRGGQELAEAPAGVNSRIRAAELLGKLMGLFTDQVNVAVTQMPKINVFSDGSAEIEDTPPENPRRMGFEA